MDQCAKEPGGYKKNNNSRKRRRLATTSFRGWEPASAASFGFPIRQASPAVTGAASACSGGATGAPRSLGINIIAVTKKARAAPVSRIP